MFSINFNTAKREEKAVFVKDNYELPNGFSLSYLMLMLSIYKIFKFDLLKTPQFINLLTSAIYSHLNLPTSYFSVLLIVMVFAFH